MNLALKKSVSCIISFPNGDILIQDHVKLGKLTIPSGGMEYGETHMQAIARELREELGIEDRDINLLSCITVENPELANRNGWREYRFHAIVDDSFQWHNAEPEKHKWIERMSFDDIDSTSRELSVILTDVVRRHYF